MAPEILSGAPDNRYNTYTHISSLLNPNKACIVFSKVYSLLFLSVIGFELISGILIKCNTKELYHV